MHESVEDGVGEGRIPDDVVPVLDRELAGDHSGADAIAVFGNLEQVAAVLGAELGEAEVVDDQDLGLGERGEELGIASVGARDGQFGQQPWQAPVRGAVTVAARAMCQCTSNPRLSDAGGPDDEDAEVFADPAPVGQRQDEVLVEPTGRAEVDVLDACIVSEAGAPDIIS